MKATQRKDLLEALEKYFDEPELRKVAFLLLGSGGYDELRGKTKGERAISLIETLDLRNRTGELVDYIKEFRPEIVLSSFGTESLEKTPIQLEFVNRVREIEAINHPYCPRYLIISAPPGYGKTRLLEAIKIQFQRQKWLCVHLELTQGQAYSLENLAMEIAQEIETRGHEYLELTSPEDYGFEIANRLLERLKNVQAAGVILLLDNVELLKPEIAKQFLDEVIVGLNAGLQSADYFNYLRIILAGRYLTDWPQLAHKIRLQIRTISPFNFPVVQESVDIFVAERKLRFSSKIKQEIASHLMYLTGGHPGGMAEILMGFPEGWTPSKYLLEREAIHYKKVIEPIINEIRNHIPEPLRDIFDTLSVIRRFNNRLLRHFIDSRLIKWPESEDDLEDGLTQTYLVSRSRKDGFLQDDMTRRLLAIRLRKINLRHFTDTCKEVLVFYENSLQDPKTTRPEIIAVELLFQKLQYSFYNQLGGKEQIFGELPEILQKLTSGREAREVTKNFLDLLMDDWEFRFTFNYLLRNEAYDDEYPYTELLQQVTTFEQNLQGVNNG